ncbi:MAG TPA: putative toxin-antitoxin system toxin component, PIN family [Candidatus Methylomirabilis sp.]
MPETRIVPDANVWISGLLWTGLPHRLLRAAEAGDLAQVTAPAIVDEVRNAIGRPKFATRIATLKTSVGELIEALLGVALVIQDRGIERVVWQDPEGDKILACAAASQAAWIVSGDTHLLALGRYQGIPRVTPRQFRQRWAKKSN